jgi:DNA-binding CsgD family transcriptional regulator
VAAPAAEEATRLLAEAGMVLFVPCAQLATALLAARRGDVATAADLADEAERTLLFAGLSPLLALVRFVRGTAALATERYEEAFGELARVFDPADVCYHPHVRSWVLPDFVEAAVHSGRLAEARARHAELAPLAAASPLLAAGLAVTAPQLAADETAGPAYEQALGADLAGLPLHRARLLLAHGSWLRRTRHTVRSKETLRAARDLFEAAGALAWGERARLELRAAGEDSAVRAPTALDLLTPQELHIAQLAAGGLSNREIGQRLYLSPRTVGSHLYRIFPKLGVTSRSGLSAMVAQVSAP